MLPLLLSLTASLAAAAPGCPEHTKPRLNGDLFAPVECSSAAVHAGPLSTPPAQPVPKPSLKDFEGRWEGTAIQGFGRYQILAELKSGWFGRYEGTLRLKELQFATKSRIGLKLSAAKGPGRFKAEFSSDALPGATLSGEALLGASLPATAAPATPQFDLEFPEGAHYRVRLIPQGKDALRVQVWWTVETAPERSFQIDLVRSTREDL